MERYEGLDVLVVERFDRECTGPDTGKPHQPSKPGDASSTARYLRRIPQEDMCQALSEPSARKYQADGGPGPDRIQTLLAGSSNESDRATFVLGLFAFWLLAAPDGHAKNFSIFLQRGGIAMTPAL